MTTRDIVTVLEHSTPPGAERPYMKFHDLTRTETGIPLKPYTHIERLGHEDVEGLLDTPVFIQNKLDGANLTVARLGSRLVVGSRNQAIYFGELNDIHQATGFNGAIEYVINHQGILTWLRSREHAHTILRGEWLVRHTLNYTPERMRRFYVFDVEYWTGSQWEYVNPEVWQPELEASGIDYISNLAVGLYSLDQLAVLSQGPDQWGAPQKEGIVIKGYGFKNKWGRICFGKIVAADFKAAAKIHMGSQKADPKEIRFIEQFVTQTLVQKNVARMSEVKGESPRIQHMAGVLSMTWHDVFTEELWDFVKNERVEMFNFRDAHKLAEKKTRDIALAIYNGVPLREDADGPLNNKTGAGKYSGVGVRERGGAPGGSGSQGEGTGVGEAAADGAGDAGPVAAEATPDHGPELA